MIGHLHISVHRGKGSGNVGSEKRPNLENGVAQTSSQPSSRLSFPAFRQFSFMKYGISVVTFTTA